MRPIRTLAPLALALVALAVAGCQRPHGHGRAGPDQRRADHHYGPGPPRAAAHPCPQAHAGPGSETIVGLWPVKTFAQARELQASVDAGHQPWQLSAESVALAYAQGELHLFGPYAQQVGPGAYQVRSHHGEWEATLYLAQPVRHDNGIWVVTRSGTR
jgi:hypothetical protein